MKKLLLIGFGLIAWSTYSQVEIRRHDETQDLSGQTINVDISTSDVIPDDQFSFWEGTKLYVYNLSGGDLQMRLKREIVVSATDWTDNICWPPNCFQTKDMNAPFETLVNFITPHNPPSNPAPIVFDGGTATNLSSTAEIKPQIYCQHPGSSATYRYSVVDINDNTVYASITVKFNYLDDLSVPTTSAVAKTTEIALSPNPSNDMVSIQAEAITNGEIQIVDVLGNVVYKSSFNSSKKLNTSEFRSGVYFITIQADNTKGLMKKLVVKH